MLAYVSKATINRRLEIWLSRYPRVPFRCFRNFHSRKSSNTFRKEFFLTDNLTIVRLFSKEKEKKEKKGEGERRGKILSINFVVFEERRSSLVAKGKFSDGQR